MMLALLFLAAVALDLNGSSIACWRLAASNDLRVQDVRSGLFVGTPKEIRGDEWFFWTTAALSQARQPQPFPVRNPALGAGTTPLLLSLPTRHYTMAFRPQLWGFFVARFDYAFAWYWNLKIFGLFAAGFGLFWVLTDGRFGWSVFGALAVQFSGFMQWWFSTPTMLPEMLTSWVVALLAALSFFLPRPWYRHLLSALVFVGCAANFALCCYPAFAVALLHLGAAIVVGYLWQKRLFSRRATCRLAGAVAVTVLALVPWLRDCLPTLHLEAATIYPGQRHAYGGSLPLVQFLSGLFTLGTDERNYAGGMNVCEAANFYPLWIVPLALGAWSFARHLSHREGVGVSEWLRERGLKVMLAGYLGLMTAYALVPLPRWFCDLTLLGRETEQRSLLGTGVAGTILLVLALASRPAAGGRLTRPAVTVALTWSLGVLAFLIWYQPVFVQFLTPGRLTAFALTAVVAVTAFLFGPRWLLPALWSAAFVARLALVNPVNVGLPELLESPMLDRLGAIVRAHPSAQWAVYNSVQGVELIKTTGAQVINGIKVIPDFDLINRLDPGHRHLNDYNRYSDLAFMDAPYQEEVPVQATAMAFRRLSLHPRRMRELFPAVRYVVATAPLDGCVEAGFQLIGAVPRNHLFLYGLPEDQR